MKFRYYIVDLLSHEVFHTDNTDTAQDFLSDGDYMVIDKEAEIWIDSEDVDVIKEIDG